MLVTHFSTLTYECILLLYAILQGMPLDVGRTIHRNILQVVREPKTSSLGHPLVITMLCMTEEIRPDPHEVPI